MGGEPVPRCQAGRGKEQGSGPDVLALPDSPTSLCSLRMEMERVQEEQSKVRQDLGQARVTGRLAAWTRPSPVLAALSVSLRPSGRRSSRPSQGSGTQKRSGSGLY